MQFRAIEGTDQITSFHEGVLSFSDSFRMKLTLGRPQASVSNRIRRGTTKNRLSVRAYSGGIWWGQYAVVWR